MVNAPSRSDLPLSYSWDGSMSETVPRPSQRRHIPPAREKDFLTALPPPTEIAPLAETGATLKE
jgi:hypothetical protein